MHRSHPLSTELCLSVASPMLISASDWRKIAHPLILFSSLLPATTSIATAVATLARLAPSLALLPLLVSSFACPERCRTLLLLPRPPTATPLPRRLHQSVLSATTLHRRARTPTTMPTATRLTDPRGMASQVRCMLVDGTIEIICHVCLGL